MLLAKTLRSSTFKLALIWIGIFGALVLALLAYVYWSTAAYVREKADRAIAAEETILRNVYDSAGRDGLIAAIKDRVPPDVSKAASTCSPIRPSFPWRVISRRGRRL